MIIIKMWPPTLAGWDLLSQDLLNFEVYFRENLT